MNFILTMRRAVGGLMSDCLRDLCQQLPSNNLIDVSKYYFTSFFWNFQAPLLLIRSWQRLALDAFAQ